MAVKSDSRRTQGRPKAWTNNNSISKSAMITVALAVLIGALHSQHLYHLFENDRYFSALSPLERDLSYRTEMGLYYSYYKTVVEAESFFEGIEMLLHDNITEYPDTINTLKRFNLYPEIVLGGAFRLTSQVLKLLEVKSDCYGIQRGQHQPPIRTCKGIGEPHYLYIYFIFGLNSLLPVSIFLLSLYSSESLLGGIISVLMFFYNHGEATRVMWTPPLRESFSMPFLFLQLLYLVRILRKNIPSVTDYLLFGMTSLFFMVPWQFAQFTMLTQVVCLHGVYSLRLLSPRKFTLLIVTSSVMLSLNTILQFGNTLLLFSYFAFSLPSCLLVVGLRSVFNKLRWSPLIVSFELAFFVTTTVFLKMAVSNFFGMKDDAHIGAILLSKFTSYEDFHTQLYTCAAEFDFLPISYLTKLCLTLLIPVALIVVSNILWQVFVLVFFGSKKNAESTNWKEETNPKKRTKLKSSNPQESRINEPPSSDLEAAHVYLTLQCLAFAGIALLIMRLKLFLTPQMAVLAGLITSKKVVFKSLSGQYRVTFTYVLIVIASMGGLWNLSDQMSIIGEYNNPDLEALVNWINNSTPEGSVFAGSMPLMATVKLTTRRPIVNHPHYEEAGIRERTKLVYTVYSQRDSEVVYQNLHSLRVQYIIMEDIWCNKQYKRGCAFHHIYLKEYPQDKDQPLFCLLVQTKKQFHHFKQVYKNKFYIVLQLMSESN